MSFLKKLFGGVAPPADSSAKVPADPANDPNLIRVYDAYGRELYITKEEWRKNVLPGSIQSNWNKPDDLYSIIIGSLNDGFRSDVLSAAEHLFKIDPQPLRSACLWGIVLMEESRLNDAERVFLDYMTRHGEDGVILTNLAKVYSHRKDDAKAGEILWRALEKDPNQENGMGWYWSIHKERGGDAGSAQALERVARIPGSWRAQLWLAREAVKRGDLGHALQLYEESLAAAPAPVPHDALMMMSGDLGNAGYVAESLRLALPRFDAAFHGLPVGNNLIKAMSDLGQIESARGILQQLYKQNRPDWKDTLSFWDTELARRNVSTAPVEPSAQLSVRMLTIAGPVWLPEQSAAHALFPVLASGAPRIGFLGCSVETAEKGDRVVQQLSDAPGRLSRALPLLLAEHVRFNAGADTRTCIPWITSPGGFVVSGVSWTDANAAQYTHIDESPSDYVAVTHLKIATEPWKAELRLIRVSDARCVATTEGFFLLNSPQMGEAALDMAQTLVGMLQRQGLNVASPLPAKHYRLPQSADFPAYLLRLEQLLAVRCSSMDGVPRSFLSGEHEIIDGNMNLCLNNPKNDVTRILLLQTVQAMKRVRPEIVGEYREKLRMLQREHPLDEPAHSICERLLAEALP